MSDRKRETNRTILPVLTLCGFIICSLVSGHVSAERVRGRPEAVELSAPEIPWGEKGISAADRKEIPLVTRVAMEAKPEDYSPTMVLGGPLKIRYKKKNVGKKEMAVWHCGFWPNHRIRLYHYDRSEVKLVARGKEGRDAFSPKGPRGKNVEWPVAAGKTDDTEGNYDLRELFDISAPGRYKVKVEYEDDVKAVSNTLTFWLLPAAAAEALETLNKWDKEECDVAERPEEYPGRKASGETNGYISTWKGLVLDHGFIPAWKPNEKRYRIERSIYTPNPELIKPGEQACEQDGDCLSVAANCCGCTAGGKATVINKAYKAEYDQRSKQNCDTRCPAVMSSHPFCGRIPVCSKGFCAWAPTK